MAFFSLFILLLHNHVFDSFIFKFSWIPNRTFTINSYFGYKTIVYFDLISSWHRTVLWKDFQFHFHYTSCNNSHLKSILNEYLHKKKTISPENKSRCCENIVLTIVTRFKWIYIEKTTVSCTMCLFCFLIHR